MLRFALVLPLAIAACGPVSVQQAERQCLDRARSAMGPRGEIAVGIGGSTRARFDIDVSSDYLAGRDPSAVYQACVYQKSGQAPMRQLMSFPEWKG
jgi:hypothetical protein